MVERLRTAIQKARAMREQLDPQGAGTLSPEQRHPDRTQGAAEDQRAAKWSALLEQPLEPGHLENNRVVSHAKNEPAHIPFDVLRTRIMRVFAEKGWTRVGITSATPNSGKTFVAANLAFSMARQQNCRTVLMDMDLRLPNMAKTLGVTDADPARAFLTGEVPVDRFFRRYGANLALGLNSQRVRDSAELILDACVGRALSTMRQHLQPDAIVYDLPPMLAFDDVTGFLPHLDCILLVACGGTTKANEIIECERLLKDQIDLLGVVLNKTEDQGSGKYGYGYY